MGKLKKKTLTLIIKKIIYWPRSIFTNHPVYMVSRIFRYIFKNSKFSRKLFFINIFTPQNKSNYQKQVLIYLQLTLYKKTFLIPFYIRGMPK